ncbi:MAG: AAA family ATPase [Bacilli bacterium]|nr:AAA family ATPase [Bacilli bacterium]
MSKVACVFSGKGGVGKTTFILCLAGVLSNMKKKVLIVDADLYNGGVATSLNKDVKKTLYHFHKEFKSDANPDFREYTVKYNQYIDFISAPKTIKEASEITFDSLDALIVESNLLYDVILFDTNHVYNKFNDLLLKRMNHIFYLITNDVLDLKNSTNNLKAIRKFTDNIDIILNYSIHFNREYFILYDIKNILQSNIDYIISNKFNYEDIDNLIIKGEILTISSQKWYDYKIFNLIAKSLIKEDKNGY